MKKILFSAIAASMFAFGFTSCSPMDSDDHSLGGSPVDPSSLSVSANVTADETGQMNLVTITNASNAQSDVRYFFCLNGKTLIETSAGASLTQIVIHRSALCLFCLRSAGDFHEFHDRKGLD